MNRDGEQSLNNSLLDVLYSRRSIRHFKPDKVSKKVIEAAIKAGSYAPSVTNKQPWEFYVLMNPENIKKIADMASERLFKIAKIADERGQAVLASTIHNFDRYTTVFREAPALILVLTDGYKTRLTEFVDTTEFKSKWFVEGVKSSSMAAQNISLMLWELGYGSCMMSAPIHLVEEDMKKMLNIPQNMSIVLLIAVGKAAEIPAPPPRKSLDKILHWCD